MVKRVRYHALVLVPKLMTEEEVRAAIREKEIEVMRGGTKISEVFFLVIFVGSCVDIYFNP